MISLNYRKFVIVVALLASCSGIAQFIPEDPFNDPYSNWTYLSNYGQIFDFDNNYRPDVKYASIMKNPAIKLHDEARTTFVLGEISADTIAPDSFYWFQMQFVGEPVNNPVPEYHDVIGGKYNFYESNTGAGVEGVGGGKRVIYENVYPSIDYHVLSGQSGPKMLIVVRPGGDPGNIMMKFEGQDSLGIDINNILRVWFRTKFVELPQGQVYQQNGAQVNLIPWQALYTNQQGSDIVTFSLGSYNTSKPLIFTINPTVGANGTPPSPPPAIRPEWCTYFGDYSVHDAITELEAGTNGEVFYTGFSQSTNTWLPANLGTTQPFATSNAGGEDAVIGKFNDNYEFEAANTWTSFFGDGKENRGNAIAYDPVNHRVAISAYNWAGPSINAPSPILIYNASIPTGLQLQFGRNIIAVFGADGPNSGIRLFSTPFQPGTQIRDIDYDASGNLYMVGDGDHTLMDLWTTGTLNFYKTGVSQNPSGGTSGYVGKFLTGMEYEWGTVFGGPENDLLFACETDSIMNRLLIVGRTNSKFDLANGYACGNGGTTDDFPLCAYSATSYTQTNLNNPSNIGGGNTDGVIAAFDLADRSLISSTLFGGDGDGDAVYDVVTNSSGDVYVTGVMVGSSLVYNYLRCDWDGTESGFPQCQGIGGVGNVWWEGLDMSTYLSRFNTDFELTYSTIIGGTSRDGLNLPGSNSDQEFWPSITVDGEDNVFIAAATRTGNAPGTIGDWPCNMVAPPGFYSQTDHSDAPYGTFGGEDAFIYGSDNQDQQIYGSYFGAPHSDDVADILAIGDRLYLAGQTNAPTWGFPAASPNITGNEYLDDDNLAGWDGFFVQLKYDLTIGVGEQEYQHEEWLVIYPNPSNNSTTIECPTGCDNAHVSVYNSIGQLVFDQMSKQEKLVFSTLSLADGVYNVIVEKGDIRLSGHLLKQ